MKVTTWAMLGSLCINLALGLVVAAVFSVAPAHAAELSHCSEAAAHARQAPARPNVVHRGYVVAARMGWAAG
jgi:hypothetical protein